MGERGAASGRGEIAAPRSPLASVNDRIARMSGNPREHVKGKGFWDGGETGGGMNRESGGRAGGFPGVRRPSNAGVKTDLEYPQAEKKSDPGAES